MRPLRVLAAIDSLTWGGAEMLLGDFAAGAPAADLDLSVIYLQGVDESPARARLRAHGLEPTLVPITLLYDPRSAARVLRHVRSERPDVVHTHLGNADLLAGLSARACGIPFFSTLHVMAWDHTGREQVKSRLMAAARRRAHRVIAVSDAAREAYLATGWDRPEHVVTVHNGIPGRARRGAGAAVRAELGLAPEDVVVTTLGVLREGKGHDVAIAAVAELRERFPALRLLVLGEGPERAAIERLAAPLGDRVVLAGQRGDVMEVLDATDVLLHPTRIDAFPTALLEAAAASLPVVSTRVGGVPEIVADGTTGVLVAPPPSAGAVAAALARLLEDPALRARMGAAGRRTFEERFTAEAWAHRLRALYEEALAARS
ncbi:MAG TPA: glycosyltransferase family 4 protein [Solirubrobacteraceae bacterium]|jgi:glycosyltransferase involved in cell wall biosynthesis|nr:glycosyltransferase family 4 protein [Solirubrobacteraceae bacterium]